MTSKIRLGLVLRPDRFILDDYTVASTRYLIQGIIDRFDCVLISNQDELKACYDDVQVFFSHEPEFAAPVLNWRGGFLGIGKRKPKLSYVLCSDPHNRQWREDYFLKSEISFMLALYYAPFKYHFKRIPDDRLIHFPWTIPDEWFSAEPNEPIQCREQDTLCCFGAANSPAYDLRNWCKEFPFVESFSFSGVENKQLRGKAYFDWLKGFDAIIAAGSDDPKFGLTTPKYLEAAAAGSLLFAQQTDDLERLGFRDGENCVVFDRGDFETKAQEYLQDPQAYLPLREAGRKMVRERHALSVRLQTLEDHVRNHL